ncbi:MAG: glycosyltransferase family 4 protein [Patescibacteria group bacterium]|jgi:glycosyltransferase involved in cell wall biosynthesis|nr:glycosyltransferase family 1 protein [bacterium]HQC49836.1 glycosyltransferase family 1 protein [bacterium]
MKIRLDARVLMDKNYSGISEYTANLLSALLKIDKQNHYELYYNSFKSPVERLQKFTGENSQLIGTRYPNKLFNYLLQKILAWPKLDKVSTSEGKVDLFFTPHFNFISLKAGTKFVLTVHDVSFLRYPEFFSWRKNIWHKLLGVKKLIRRADQIIAVSENTKADLIELLGVNPEKVTVIYSGNNFGDNEQGDERGNRQNNEQEAENKLAGENELNYLKTNNLRPGFFLYLGNIEPRKNISGLIKAYNRWRLQQPETENRQLVLAGKKGWRYRRIFKDWKQSPYQADIKFLGYVDKKVKEYLFKQASAFIYPSFYEGFGFPPLEAMYFGTPVVSANVSSLPEILGDSALLIDPYNLDEIVEALEIITKDKLIRERLIKKGRERASEFTWDKAARKYLEIFTQLNDRQEKHN